MSLNLLCVYSPTGSQSNSTCSPARSSPAPRTGSALILFPVGFAHPTFRYMLKSLNYVHNNSEKNIEYQVVYRLLIQQMSKNIASSWLT